MIIGRVLEQKLLYFKLGYWDIHFTLRKVKLKKTHKIFIWKRHLLFNMKIEPCVKYIIIQMASAGSFTGLNPFEVICNHFTLHFRKYLP